MNSLNDFSYSPPAILVVDDEVHSQSAIRRTLEDDFYVLTASDSDGARKLLETERIALILCDQRMPGLSGVEFLQEVKDRWPETVRIIISGYTDSQDIVKGINQAGIYQYILKPWNPSELLHSVKTAIEASELQLSTERRELQIRQSLPQLRKQEQGKLNDLKNLFAFNCLIRSPNGLMQSVCETAEKIAEYDISVLLSGESGTGKELMAKAIHYSSPRANNALVVENCAALSDDLLESELFGHKRGAFTGAFDDHIGLFQRAHGGTLFLDEIGETSPAMQVKLLRALQEGEIRPVGSQRSVAVDVRVIVATHRNLEKEVQAGRFREDLYYRIAEITLELPPLRERTNDIILISEHILNEVSVQLGRQEVSLSRDAIKLIRSYPWPGNVRQLRNELLRAVALSPPEKTHLEAADFPAKMTQPVLTENPITIASSSNLLNREEVPRQPNKIGLRSQMDEVEVQVLQDTMQRHRWNKTSAAKELGISRVGLRQKLRRLGLE